MIAKRHKVGSVILTVGALGSTGATAAIFMQGPEITTTNGRLLCAGALANRSLSFLMALIAALPLRQGKRWAFFAYIVPFAIYGIPILILDTTQVMPDQLFSTLVPQASGLLIATIGLVLVAPGVFSSEI